MLTSHDLYAELHRMHIGEAKPRLHTVGVPTMLRSRSNAGSQSDLGTVVFRIELAL